MFGSNFYGAPYFGQAGTENFTARRFVNLVVRCLLRHRTVRLVSEQ